MPEPTVDCTHHACLESFLTKGHEAAQRKDFTGAIAQFDQGLEILGRTYWTENLLDDTDLKLGLAEAMQQKGDLARAAALKERLFSERLGLFKKKTSP